MSAFANDPDKLARFAWQAHVCGNQAIARQALQAALSAAPTHAQSWLALGLIEAAAKDWRRARRALRKATVHDFYNVQAWCALAEVSLELNDFSLLTRAVKRVISISPDTAEGTRAQMLAIKAHKRLRALSSR